MTHGSSARSLPLHVWLTVLLVLSAAAFAGGVALERSGIDRPHETAALSGEGTGEGSGTEGTGEGAGSTGESATASGSERFLGIQTESTGLVAAVVALSVALATAVALARRSRPLLLLVAAFALVSLIFDIREVVHQIHESRLLIAAVAGLVAVLHAGLAGLALLARSSVGPEGQPVAL
jgi:hypothetical protein